jgi:hypothetical protein
MIAVLAIAMVGIALAVAAVLLGVYRALRGGE